MAWKNKLIRATFTICMSIAMLLNIQPWPFVIRHHFPDKAFFNVRAKDILKDIVRNTTKPMKESRTRQFKPPVLPLSATNLEDETFLAAVGHGKLNLTVQATRAQQGRVQGVSAVGGHYYLHIDILVEAIHLVQQLHQNALHLPAPQDTPLSSTLSMTV